mgnify:CR=1 FL=1
MSDYINELNESQRAAVLYNDGPSLVIAGAGSGKTRVLTYKIAWLLENGYQPWNILALTFTNKAARELKARLENMLRSTPCSCASSIPRPMCWASRISSPSTTRPTARA